MAEPPQGDPEDLAPQAVKGLELFAVETDNDGVPEVVAEMVVGPPTLVEVHQDEVLEAVREVVAAEDAAREILHDHGNGVIHVHPAVVQQVEQRVQMARTSVKSLKTESAVEDLGLLVKQRRFARLNLYAQKYQWSTEHPPAKAVERPQIGVWWQEWRELRPEAAP